jgi:hypothetical protein
MTNPIDPKPVESKPVDPDAALKARRRRNSIALGIVLGLVVIIFYALTIVKMGPALFNRDL